MRKRERKKVQIKELRQKDRTYEEERVKGMRLWERKQRQAKEESKVQWLWENNSCSRGHEFE